MSRGPIRVDAEGPVTEIAVKPSRILEIPFVYELKSAMLSFGRRSVHDYLRANVFSTSQRRVLDVGCGTGRHADIWSTQYCGVDINRAYIAYARQKHTGSFLVADATRLTFPDETFDLAFCAGLFHHLPADKVVQAAREMKRVTRTGGRAVVIDGVRPAKTNVIGFILASRDRGEYARTHDDLARILQPEGFTLTVRDIPRSFPFVRAVFSCQK